MTLAQPAVHATRPNHSLILAACIAAAASLATGCAGTPEPTKQLVAARQALTAAEQAQAVEHAADLMTESRTKLGLAEAAAKDDEMEQAGRLADEARVDAELAIAQATAIKAEAVNDEMRQGNETLRDEMQRQNAGGTR